MHSIIDFDADLNESVTVLQLPEYLKALLREPVDARELTLHQQVEQKLCIFTISLPAGPGAANLDGITAPDLMTKVV